MALLLHTDCPSGCKQAVQKMRYRNLGNTVMKVSIISYGASSLGSVFRDTDLGKKATAPRNQPRNRFSFILLFCVLAVFFRLFLTATAKKML